MDQFQDEDDITRTDVLKQNKGYYKACVFCDTQFPPVTVYGRTFMGITLLTQNRCRTQFTGAVSFT